MCDRVYLFACLFVCLCVCLFGSTSNCHCVRALLHWCIMRALMFPSLRTCMHNRCTPQPSPTCNTQHTHHPILPYAPSPIRHTPSHHSEAARQELDSFDGLSVGLRQTGRGIATRYNIAAAGLRAASLVREILFLAASVMQLLVMTELNSSYLMLYPDESSISPSQLRMTAWV